MYKHKNHKIMIIIINQYPQISINVIITVWLDIHTVVKTTVVLFFRAPRMWDSEFPVEISRLNSEMKIDITFFCRRFLYLTGSGDFEILLIFEIAWLVCVGGMRGRYAFLAVFWSQLCSAVRRPHKITIKMVHIYQRICWEYSRNFRRHPRFAYAKVKIPFSILKF